MTVFTKIACAFAICLVSRGALASPKPLIVGGSQAAHGEFPFIASLQADDFGHFCGGSLINRNWILTAGHCVEGGYINTVYIGLDEQHDVSRAEAHKVKRVIRHPQYDEQTTDYDFALIELDTPSVYPPIELNADELQVPTQPGLPQLMGIVAGWGETLGAQIAPANLSERLQKVEVPLVPTAVCEASYKGLITDRMLCAGLSAGGKDSCQGDSGGPLTMLDAAHHLKLIGVVSWGEGCAQPDKYGVYSKVNSVLPWIEQTAI